MRNSVDVITATSVESLQNLVHLLAEPMGEWLWSRPLFMIHPRQLTSAHAIGFKIIPAVATETNDEALLSAIIKWRQQVKQNQ
jgi:uroporphyrinogen-III synthase